MNAYPRTPNAIMAIRARCVLDSPFEANHLLSTNMAQNLKDACVMLRSRCKAAAIVFTVGMAVSLSANAQNQNNTRDRQSSQDQYSMCQRQASEMSGYYGPTPSRERRGGGALRGALKGAAAGAAIGAIGDKDVGKAAKRGAGLGLLLGAIAEGSRKSREKERRRDEDNRRMAYQMHLDNCMRYSGR